MQITVKLHGAFSVGRFKENLIEYPLGITVHEVVERLQLPKSILGIVLINEVHSIEQVQLRDGDVLDLLPILDGG